MQQSTAKMHSGEYHHFKKDVLQICKEETLGPAVPLFKFKHDEEAIKLANETIYDLASYVYTRVCHALILLARSRCMHAVDLGSGCTKKDDSSVPPFQLHVFVLGSSLTLYVRDSQLCRRHSMTYFR